MSFQSISIQWKSQGRRRLFKIGPAEEIIECRRPEREITPPLVRGVWGVSPPPPEKKFEFWAFLCAFLMGFYAFRTRFQSFWSRSFARKEIFCHARNQMQDKIVFRQSRFLFFTACFFDIISSMSPQGLESTFSTDSWWYFKESCFRKDIHLV